MYDVPLDVREALAAARPSSHDASLPVTLFRLVDGSTERIMLGELYSRDAGPVVRAGDVIQVGSPRRHGPEGPVAQSNR